MGREGNEIKQGSLTKLTTLVAFQHDITPLLCLHRHGVEVDYP